MRIVPCRAPTMHNHHNHVLCTGSGSLKHAREAAMQISRVLSVVCVALAAVCLGRATDCPGTVDYLHGLNAGEFDGCTRVTGNVVINQSSLEGDSSASIPPITPSELNVLNSVHEIDGYLQVENFDHENLTNLRFLRNLETIHGFQTVEKRAGFHYSLVVEGNDFLQTLGLASLREIVNGGIRIANNPALCLVDTITVEEFLVNSDLSRVGGLAQDCNAVTCHEECETTRGCWGTLADECVQCRNYEYRGTCVPQCDPSVSYANTTSQECIPIPEVTTSDIKTTPAIHHTQQLQPTVVESIFTRTPTSSYTAIQVATTVGSTHMSEHLVVTPETKSEVILPEHSATSVPQVDLVATPATEPEVVLPEHSATSVPQVDLVATPETEPEMATNSTALVLPATSVPPVEVARDSDTSISMWVTHVAPGVVLGTILVAAVTVLVILGLFCVYRHSKKSKSILLDHSGGSQVKYSEHPETQTSASNTPHPPRQRVSINSLTHTRSTFQRHTLPKTQSAIPRPTAHVTSHGNHMPQYPSCSPTHTFSSGKSSTVSQTSAEIPSYRGLPRSHTSTGISSAATLLREVPHSPITAPEEASTRGRYKEGFRPAFQTSPGAPTFGSVYSARNTQPHRSVTTVPGSSSSHNTSTRTSRTSHTLSTIL